MSEAIAAPRMPKDGINIHSRMAVRHKLINSPSDGMLGFPKPFNPEERVIFIPETLAAMIRTLAAGSAAENSLPNNMFIIRLDANNITSTTTIEHQKDNLNDIENDFLLSRAIVCAEIVGKVMVAIASVIKFTPLLMVTATTYNPNMSAVSIIDISIWSRRIFNREDILPICDLIPYPIICLIGIW